MHAVRVNHYNLNHEPASVVCGVWMFIVTVNIKY